MRTLKKLASLGKEVGYVQVISRLRRIRKHYYECTVKHGENNVNALYRLQDTDQGYNRYDIIVRYLAIEEYYGKNEVGFSLYRKMQGNRIDFSYMNESEEKFRRLIASWEIEGYDKKSEISLDKNLSLIDGSHRIALALYHGQKTVACKIYKKKTDCYYGIMWFTQHGFSHTEIDLILSKEKEIRRKLEDC